MSHASAVKCIIGRDDLSASGASRAQQDRADSAGMAGSIPGKWAHLALEWPKHTVDSPFDLPVAHEQQNNNLVLLLIF